MGINVKHPGALLIIWFGLGWFAVDYGIETVTQAIIFCFGAIGLYTIVSKYLS